MLSRNFWVPLAASLLLAAPLTAQDRSTTRGFTLGGMVNGINFHPEGIESTSGAGLALTGSYGFRNGLSIVLNSGAALMPESEDGTQSYMLGQGDIGLRYTFRNTEKRWRPYVEADLSVVFLTWENMDFGNFGRTDVELNGPAFSARGGFQYFLNPRWSLDTDAAWSTGTVNEVKIRGATFQLDSEDQFNLKNYTIQLGFRYHFVGRNANSPQ